MRVKKSINVTGLLARDDGWSLWCRHFLFLWVQSSGWKSVSVFSNQGRTMGQRKKEFPWPDAPHTPSVEAGAWSLWHHWSVWLTHIMKEILVSVICRFCSFHLNTYILLTIWYKSTVLQVHVSSKFVPFYLHLYYLAIYGVPLPQCQTVAIHRSGIE